MSEYWKSRRLDDVFDKNADKMLKNLKKIYKEQAKEIEKAITEIYIKMLEDGEISNTNLYKLNRYNDLVLEINKILKSYGEEEVKIITKGLEIATEELIEDIHKNSHISFVMINENQIKEIVNTSFKGKNFSKRIWANRENLSKSIQKNIQNVIAIGMNKDKAVKEIMDIHNSSFFNADRLVRTETMRCLNSGTIETYKTRGRTHGYYIYALDRRTCQNCIDIAEKTKVNPLPLDELEPVHHPNCRCTILPVVDIDNLKNEEKDDIINKNSKDNIQLYSIGKLENKIYKNKFKDLVTDEIIITDKQISHVEERRKGFYETYNKYFKDIINKPDIIFEDNKNKNTVLICKEVIEEDNKVCIVLRLVLSEDNPNFKNSIITAHPIGERNINKYVRTKKIIYKK